MTTFTRLVVLAVGLAHGSAALAQESRELGPAEAIAGYYAGEPLPWRDRVDRLESPEADTRAKAARYLRDLLTQLDDDQYHGRSTLRAVPYWGQGSEDLSLKAREAIAEELASRASSPAVLDILVSIVSRDRTPSVVATALAPILIDRSDQATKVLVRVVDDDLGGATTIAKSLLALAERGVTPSPAAINRCLKSHRSKVRAAAGEHAKKAGVPIPDPPAGVAWLETAAAKPMIAELLRLVGPPLKPGTSWVEVHPRIITDLEETDWPVSQRGWLLKETPDSIDIESPTGYVKFVPKRGREIRRTVTQPDSRSWSVKEEPLDAEYHYRIVPVQVEVERVILLRANMNAPEAARERSTTSQPTFHVRLESDPPDRYDLRGAFSDEGTLTAQFEPFGYSLYEVLLAVRIHQIGMLKEAAHLLAPLVDASPDDAEFVHFVEWHLGCALGHRMISRFCEHDLAGTESIARRLVQDFPRSPFIKLAKRLLIEIPQRPDDWTSFRLPTPDEWTKIASGLDRASQIKYLCSRVRLVSHAGAGLLQSSPSWTQQSVDSPHADYRATDVSPGWNLAINPLAALKDGPLSPRPDGTGARGIDRHDFELLRSCVRPAWLAPCVSAWRHFHFGRTVSTDAEVIERLIAEVER